MKYLYLTIFLFLCLSLSAQSDTVFYDRHDQLSETKDLNGSYGLVEKIEEFYIVKRFLTGSGILEAEETYKDSTLLIKHGIRTEYYESGIIESIQQYSNDTLSGLNKYFYETGELYYTWEFSEDDIIERLRVYFPDGNLKRAESYKGEYFMSGTCFNNKGKEIKYFDWQIQATFSGDYESLSSYLSDHIRHPKEIKLVNHRVETIVRFCVGADGSILEAFALESSGIPTWDKAAVDVMLGMPKWKPAFRDKLPVEYWFRIPIIYQP